MRIIFAVLLPMLLSACGSSVPEPDLLGGTNGVNESLSGTQRISACTQTATLSANTLNGYACYADQEVVSMNVLNWVAKPIRYARVEVLRNSDDVLMLSTKTDASGYYAFATTALAAGVDFRVRVVTSGALSASDTNVVDDGNYLYALASSAFQTTSSGKTQNLVAASDVIGQAFNVFDQMVKGQRYLLNVAGVASVVGMDAVWYVGNQYGTYYCSRDFAIYPISECPTGPAMHVLGDVSDSDGYDDAVILHEYGHFVLEYFSRDDSPGGTHYLSQTDQDLRLSWSEGFATAFGTLAQQYAGEANADRYLDSDGAGGFFLEYYLEGPTGGANVLSPKTNAYGIGNEVAISVALWDMADDSGTTETFDSISQPGVLWDAIKLLSGLTTEATFQDFWQDWAGSNLQTILEDRRIFMTPDAYESDDTLANAQSITVNATAAQQHSLHSVSDVDWVSVTLVAGTNYAFSTTELLSSARVLLGLYDVNGVLVTASGLSNPASYLNFTPTTGGTYYVRASRDTTSPVFVRYGSYKLQVKTY